MKKLTLVLILLFLSLAVCAFAKKHKTEDLFIYNHNTSYNGPFKKSKIYNRDERNRIWFPSTRFQNIKKITCTEARTGLQSGTWVGNISDDGQCLDPGEAPEWTTGNFLNFISETSKLRKKESSPGSDDASPRNDSDE